MNALYGRSDSAAKASSKRLICSFLRGYRYASGSEVSGGFAEADLADPFKRRGGD